MTAQQGTVVHLAHQRPEAQGQQVKWAPPSRGPPDPPFALFHLGPIQLCPQRASALKVKEIRCKRGEETGGCLLNNLM